MHLTSTCNCFSRIKEFVFHIANSFWRERYIKSNQIKSNQTAIQGALPTLFSGASRVLANLDTFQCWPLGTWSISTGWFQREAHKVATFRHMCYSIVELMQNDWIGRPFNLSGKKSVMGEYGVCVPYICSMIVLPSIADHMKGVLGIKPLVVCVHNAYVYTYVYTNVICTYIWT